MKKFTKTLAMMALCAIVMTSCYSITHVVGSGGTGETINKRQWYILFGLVPLNEVDTKAIAGGATDYTITTKHTFVDYVIGAFTGIVSVYPMTVQVKK